jgi:hypothetical protein
VLMPAWQDDSTFSIEVNLLNENPMKSVIDVKEFSFRTAVVISPRSAMDMDMEVD